MSAPLPVLALVADAYATVSANLGPLLRLGRGPFVVAMVLGLFFGAMQPVAAAPLALLATLVAYAWFSFLVIRLTLLGAPRAELPRPGARSGEGPLIPRSNLGTYMVRALGIAVLFGAGIGVMLLVVVVPLTMPGAPPPSGAAEPGRFAVANLIMAALLAALPFGVPVVRLLPLLPAAAVEVELTVPRAWALSRGHGLRLTVALVLLLLPFALGYAALHATQVMIAAMAGGDPGLLTTLPALVLATAVCLTATALASVAIARAFALMTGEAGQPTPDRPAPPS